MDGDRLRRSGPDRLLLGVCGGLGDALGVDSVLLRLGFVLAVPLGGIGVAAYVMTAALMGAPDAWRARRAPAAPADGRTRPAAPARAAVARGERAAAAARRARSERAAARRPRARVATGGDRLGARRGPWLGPAGARRRAPRAGRGGAPDRRRAAVPRQGTDITAAAASAIAAAVVAAGIGLLVGPRLRRAQAVRERRAARAHPHRGARRDGGAAARLGPADARADPARRTTRAAAQRLARRQERELRAWLYGGEEPDAPDTFAAALRARDRRRSRTRYDITVELVQPSDAPLDDDLEALVGAAREALTNAAKHAGADTVVGARPRERPRGVACSCATAGRGFDRAAVPRDRAGRARVDRRRGWPATAARADIHTAPGRGHRGRADPAARSPAVNLPLRRVVLVDDHEIFRAGLQAELGAAASRSSARPARVEAAVAADPRHDPDVVLLDVHLPGGGGQAVIGPVHAERPGVRFLALSVSDAAEDVIAVIRAGARGYVTKTISAGRADRRHPPGRRRRRRLLPAPRRLRARRVHAGDAPARGATPSSTSSRRASRTCCCCIARGYTYKEIAAPAAPLGQDDRDARLQRAAQAAALQPPRADPLGREAPHGVTRSPPVRVATRTRARGNVGA